jgi:hypothetical protein
MMRFGSLHILAEADIAKVVFGIIVFVVWGISSLASMVKKANEQARRRAIARGPAKAVSTDRRMVVGGFATGPGSRPPPLPASLLQRVKTPVQKRAPVKQVPKMVAQPVTRAVAAPRAQAPPPSVSSRPIVEKVSSISQTNSARTNLAGAKAPAIRRWLVPATLRKQFILTELLRPPIALREESER